MEEKVSPSLSLAAGMTAAKTASVSVKDLCVHYIGRCFCQMFYTFSLLFSHTNAGMEEFCSDGSEFYVAFFDNLAVSPLFSRASIKLKIDNMEDFQQTVTYTYKSDVRKEEIEPRSSVEISPPIEMRFEAVGETDKGVFIKSMNGTRLSITAFGTEFSSSDTYTILPCVYLPSQYEYYAVSVAKDNRMIDEDGAVFPATPSGDSVVAFISSEENTAVTITPSQDVEILKETTTVAGTSLELKLGKGEAVFFSTIEDLTGTHVMSDKPLAFFSGHECGNMPAGLQFCDHMVEQIPPTATWGTEFFTASFINRPEDRFRIITSRDDNSVTWVCSGDITDERSLPTAGDIIEFSITENSFCRFKSVYPVLLAQFSIGGGETSFTADPSMTIIPPVGQYRSSYMLNYFTGLRVSNHVNIFLLNTPGVTTDGTLLNDDPVSGSWTDILCEEGRICAHGIQVVVSETTDGVTSLSHSNKEAKLLGIPYSTDVRTSRATFGGMTQKPIARTSTVCFPE